MSVLMISFPSHNQGLMAVAIPGLRLGSCQAWVRLPSLVLISSVAKALPTLSLRIPICKMEMLTLSRLASVRTAAAGHRNGPVVVAAVILSAQPGLEHGPPPQSYALSHVLFLDFWTSDRSWE